MNDLDQIICNDYKVGHINSVTRIRHPTLSIYYKLWLLREHDRLYVNYILFKITLITLDFHTIDNN